MKKKRLLIALVCVALVAGFTFVGCGNGGGGNGGGGTQEGNGAAADTTYNLILGHVVAEATSLHWGALELSRLVYERTGGRVHIDVFANAALGDNREGMEALQIGTAHMWIPNISTLNMFTPATQVFELPYLILNDASGAAVFEGPLGAHVFSPLEDIGIIYLASFSQGWRQLTTANTPVRHPSDMQGLMIRTMDSPLHMAHFNALGANATPLPFSELFVALQTGAFDAQENPWINIYTQAFFEVQNYIIETSHIFDVTPVIMSRSALERLPAEFQQIIRDTALELAPLQRQKTADEAEIVRQTIIDSGAVTVITLTPEERHEFFMAAQPVYDEFVPALEEILGAGFVQQIIDAQEGF